MSSIFLKLVPVGHHGHAAAGRVDELDGLRGLLALWVVVSHVFCLTGAAEIERPLHLQSVWQTFSYAQPAVETFMILSGFAISFLLHARPQSYLGFMTGRFFRIVPVYLFCLAMGAWVSWEFTPWFLSHAAWRNGAYLLGMQAQSTVEHQYFWACLGSHLVLLHGAVPDSVLRFSATAFLPPAWSISVEWQYYLLAPLLARMVRSNLAVVALLFVCLVFNREDIGMSQRAFLPQRLDLFLLGIGSYHLYAAWKSAGAPRFSWSARLVTAAFVVGMLSGTHSVAVDIWVTAFGSGFLVARDPVSRLLGRVRAALLHPGIQYLGRWSYPLYLVHWPVLVLCLCALLQVDPRIPGAEARLVMLIFAVPLTLAISALVHHGIELPFMRLGRRAARVKAIPAEHVPLRKVT